MRGLASVLAADTREPRLCAALRAYAVPSSGFVMQPHEDPLPPLGFLDFEQRGQFEATPSGRCKNTAGANDREKKPAPRPMLGAGGRR